MGTIIVYAFVSVLLVSMVSLVAVLAFSIRMEVLKKVLIYMVSFSAGALLSGAFMHLLPEAVEESGFTVRISLYVLSGILVSFLLEKVIHWRHCHNPSHIDAKVHSFAYMNLFGDGVHNFIDGMIIGATYLVSIEAGIVATVAIILHEIPQEIGDFGVLLHGGFTRWKAVLFNFLTALTAILGTAVTLIIGSYSDHLTLFLVPFAAGGFVYIACADLIPELHKETSVKKNMAQFIFLILGVIFTSSLIFSENGHANNVSDTHSDANSAIVEQN